MKARTGIMRYPTARSGWWNVMFGLWLVASPWLFGFADEAAARWNCVITGSVIAGFAWGHRTKNRTRTGLDVLLGIWLVAAPFLLDFTAVSLWNSVVVGSMVVLINGSAR